MATEALIGKRVNNQLVTQKTTLEKWKKNKPFASREGWFLITDDMLEPVKEEKPEPEQPKQETPKEETKEEKPEQVAPKLKAEKPKKKKKALTDEI